LYLVDALLKRAASDPTAAALVHFEAVEALRAGGAHGVRIEDNVAVLQDGCLNLTMAPGVALPKAVHELEEAMAAEAQAGVSPSSKLMTVLESALA
jgi:hypothetical protein